MNYELFGDAYIEVPNEPEAFAIDYLLKADGATADVTVTDAGGKVVRQVTGPAKAGFNRVLVPLSGSGGRGRGGRGAAPVAPLTVGDYTVTLDVEGQKLTKTATVRTRIGMT